MKIKDTMASFKVIPHLLVNAESSSNIETRNNGTRYTKASSVHFQMENAQSAVGAFA